MSCVYILSNLYLYINPCSLFLYIIYCTVYTIVQGIAQNVFIKDLTNEALYLGQVWPGE